MKNRSLCLVAMLAVVLTAGFANAVTIATFADPTIGGPVVPMFNVQDVAPGVGVVTGGWVGPNLNLEVAATTYTNATLVFQAIGYTGTFTNGTLGAGVFSFFDSSNNPIFTVLFNSARVNVGGLAGDNIFSSDGVQFVGPAVVPLGPLTNESFAFSFTNQTPIPNGFSATAAFTSSATLIPEPATMIILALGSVFVAIRRRR